MHNDNKFLIFYVQEIRFIFSSKVHSGIKMILTWFKDMDLEK